jgi:dienelactone hydrolase
LGLVAGASSEGYEREADRQTGDGPSHHLTTLPAMVGGDQREHCLAFATRHFGSWVLLRPRSNTVRFVRGVRVERIDTDGLVGDLCVPDDAVVGGVLALGGSEGGVPSEIARAIAADTGMVCLGLAYFNAPSLPRRLIEIPLEYVEHAAHWLLEQTAEPVSTVGLFGVSKGAELVLLAAATFPELFSAVTAVVPSSAVFEGIGSRGRCGRSSWTYGGRPLPFVPYRGLPRLGLRGVRAASMYKGALVSDADAAAIAVERIGCPVLLISGGDDQLWPSKAMADRIAARIRTIGGSVEHICYPDAGHTVTLPALDAPLPLIARFADMGGTPAANRNAAQDAWPRTIAFLIGAPPR